MFNLLLVSTTKSKIWAKLKIAFEKYKMAVEAKPVLEMFLDYYNHVMIDLRDPRFMIWYDHICNALKSQHIVRQSSIQLYVVLFGRKIHS